MSAFKNKQYLKLDYKAGFHKFSTIGDGSCNIPLNTLVTSNLVDVFSIRGSNVGIGTMFPVVSLDTNRTDAYKLPAGSTLQRPEGVQGYIRYNTDTSQFEGFGAGNSWGSLGGVKSTDQYTYITAELTPGNNDSNLRFYTSGIQQAIINQQGNLGIGTALPIQKIHVQGNAYVSETLTASNLVIFGSSTILNTVTSNTEQIVITNDGTGPALKVTQTGNNSVAEFYDKETGIALFIGNNGNVGIGSTQPQVSFVINRTDSVLLPKGSTGERPTGVQGYIRYNTDTNQFEGFGAGNSWGSLGGVKSTDQLTYITAELSPGNNDSNLRFYTSGIQQAIINPDGNLGIGTATPRYKFDVVGNTIISGNLGIGTTIPSERLRVEGDLFVSEEAHIVNVVTTNNINTTNVYTSNLSTSNFTVLQNFYYAPENTYVRTHYQINPIRYTSVVAQQGTTTFNFTMDGLYKFLPTHAEIYQNGYKLAYYASNIKDYDVTYVNNEINTSITVTLEEPTQYNDIIDIYLWPSYLNVDGILQPGYVIQNIDYTYWNRYDSITSNIYYTSGNVGIGTTTGPGVLNVSGLSYLNGPVTTNNNNINAGTGTITASSFSGTFSGTATQVSQLLSTGNYLTGTNYNGSIATTWDVDATTVATANKVVARDASANIYSAGVGIGTTSIRQAADVIGNAIVSGNLGIGTDTPIYKLQVQGNAYVSETLTASNLVIFGSSTILNTVTSNTEQIVITNDGTGPALKVTQTGNNSVAEFYDNETGIALFIGNNGNVGIGSTQPQVSLVINKTDSLLLPKGSTVQRPSGVQGYIRYNTDTNQFEGFGAGNSWGSLGGVKSTDQYTYITAELTPGNNDSNLRFYTSAQQQAIINPYGNLGIGTANPTEKLHIEGSVYISNKLTASNIISNNAILNTIINSNLTVYGELNFGPNSSTLRTNLQVNPIRKVIYINTETSNVFNIQTSGIYNAYSSNAQVFLNQALLMNNSDNIQDYEISSSYISNPPVTTFVISLTSPAVYGDILDITIWPQLIQESATNPGYVYQQVRVSETHFTEINNNLAFINGNIGIGTTNVSSGRLVVAGNIVPSSCNIYDLGTSNLRFRDLYLSGNTIDLGGTKLSREEQTGGLSVLSSTGQPSDIRTNSVYIANTLEFIHTPFIINAGGNVGIGTTNPIQSLYVQGNSYLNGPITTNNNNINAGTGTITSGAITTSGNIGIGRTNPSAFLQIRKVDILNTVQGSKIPLVNISADNDGNVGMLDIYEYRTTAGTGWQNASTRIQKMTDVTQQAYIEFNPPNSSSPITGAIAFGNQASTEWMRITASGDVGIGTTNPVNKLDVQGTITSSGGYRFPDGTTQMTAGSIVQVQHVQTPPTRYAIAAQNLEAIPNLSISFTPKFANSKILLTAMINSTATYVATFGFLKNGSVIISNTNNNSTGSIATRWDGNSGANVMNNVNIVYMDTATSTSAITYEAGASSSWLGTIYTIYINDRNTSDMLSISSMTIYEIAV